MARKTRSHSRTITRIKTRKHRNNHNHKHKHKHSKSCTCKYCSSAKKGSRTHRRTPTRSRRGGTQTAVGGNMIYKGGQWYSYNPVGGRS